VMVKGKESVRGYAEILSKIHYFNTRPESFTRRLYTVQCALSGGKLLSNEFFVTMSIGGGENGEHLMELAKLSKELETFSDDTEAGEEEGKKMEKHFQPSFDQLGAKRLQNILEMELPRPKALLSHHGYEMGQGAVAGGAVAVVVVICIGFLLVLLVVGVLKMRDTPLPHRRRSRKPTMEGMEWDDNGMNIIVNPLEDVEKSSSHNPLAGDYSEEDEEGDEESSGDEDEYRDDDELTEDDEEAEAQVLPHVENGNGKHGLEWDDDSALPTHSKSYRV